MQIDNAIEEKCKIKISLDMMKIKIKYIEQNDNIV
jgi:hypothetical protein